jgi:hypothetical protein
MKKTLALATVLGALAVSSAAMAEEEWCEPGGTVTEDQAKAMLEEQGYQVKKMDEEHGCLEAKALDPDGKRVEVYVDGHTGKIIRVKD